MLPLVPAAVALRFHHVYLPDRRFGDCLLNPERWCVHKLNTLRVNAHQAHLLQRLARFTLLILAYGFKPVSLVGVCLKAISGPPPVIQLPVVPAPVAPANGAPPRRRAHADIRFSMESPVGYIEDRQTFTTIALSNPPFFQQGTGLPQELRIYIVSFLPVQDLLRFMGLSTNCYQVAKSIYVWNRILLPNQVAGPMREWTFPQIRNGQELAGGDNIPFVHPYEQLKAYAEMRRRNPQVPDLFQYLARLNKGGPILFNNLPRLRLEGLDGVQLPATPNDPIVGVLPEHLTHSVMVGTHRQGDVLRNFIAFRVIDRAQPDATPTVLLLIQQNPRRESWVHNANGIWGANGVNPDHQTHINFLLYLFKGEAYSELPLGFSNKVELI